MNLQIFVTTIKLSTSKLIKPIDSLFTQTNKLFSNYYQATISTQVTYASIDTCHECPTLDSPIFLFSPNVTLDYTTFTDKKKLTLFSLLFKLRRRPCRAVGPCSWPIISHERASRSVCPIVVVLPRSER